LAKIIMARKKVSRKNPTTEVVQAAMKEVSKDVRPPKAVRDGLVKKQTRKTKKESPSPTPRINIAAKSAIDYIILDDSIKLKAKHIKNTPTFSQTRETIQLPTDLEPGFITTRYIPSRVNCEDVTVEIDVRMKKLSRIMELFHAQRRISFTMANQNGLKIVSTGFLKAIEHSLEGGISFTYCPNEFSVL
jgi:hypothetical protein